MKTSGESILSISNLSKRYGATPVLEDINLHMAAGEFLVLIGPSGSGKSTLLSCVAGLTEVSEGTITIDGRDMTRVVPARRNVAMVFQSYALFPSMTVAGNISFGMEVRGVDSRERARRLAQVAKSLEIVSLLERRPAELSGGQRQRVAMARALVRNPKLFLFDEPLSNLDAKLRASMRQEIKRFHRQNKGSTVYVTHDQIEAMTLASRIVLLRDGRIQQVGSPLELYNDPVNIFVATFMGAPAMNLIPATVCMAENRLTLRFRDSSKTPCKLTDHQLIPDLAGAENRPVLLGIRPEAIRVSHTPEADNTLLLPVDLVDRTGGDTYLTLALEQSCMVSRMPGDLDVEEGTPLPLAFDLSRACYFDPETGKRLR